MYLGHIDKYYVVFLILGKKGHIVYNYVAFLYINLKIIKREVK
ncbi:putative membrane protein [[Clostridium] sordellii ATCC 9714]|nr:putative membrane protein [[Clostridium] sordellii ATCC 9714] [Paeniclostridium sordellii ATCC 9714]